MYFNFTEGEQKLIGISQNKWKVGILKQKLPDSHGANIRSSRFEREVKIIVVAVVSVIVVVVIGVMKSRTERKEFLLDTALTSNLRWLSIIS